MATDDDRGLVYNRRLELQGQPGTHALVIGISRYPHLPPAGQPGDRPADAARTFGLTELPIAARSAVLFRDWLEKHGPRLAAPLKTLRVLVAPCPEEERTRAVPDLDRVRSAGTLADVAAAVYAWREDAAAGPGDTTLFYFCGNGFDFRTSDPVLVLADFGSGRGPRLQGTLPVNHLLRGMAPTDWSPAVARTQLYFFDAGRRRPEGVDPDDLAAAPQLFDLPRHPPADDRKLFVCHATSSGGRAWGTSRGTTFFSLAVTRCLAGEAAVAAPDGRAWQVTTGSLAAALPRVLERLSRDSGLPDDARQSQQVAIRTAHADDAAVLVRLDQPPTVPVVVRVEPAGAAGRAVLEATAATGAAVRVEPVVGRDGTLRFYLPAGLYFVRVAFRPPAGGAAERAVSFIVTVTPPEALCQIRAEPEAPTPP